MRWKRCRNKAERVPPKLRSKGGFLSPLTAFRTEHFSDTLREVNKVKLFLYVDGVVLLLGALFLRRLYQQRRNFSHFREDLWAGKSPKAEDKIDKKILANPLPQEGKAPFRSPNFRGKPHEVLGLPENPSREQVQAAFKYWIKRYHPDHVSHLGPQYVEQAKHRTEQLNAAREKLLK